MPLLEQSKGDAFVDTTNYNDLVRAARAFRALHFDPAYFITDLHGEAPVVTFNAAALARNNIFRPYKTADLKLTVTAGNCIVRGQLNQVAETESTLTPTGDGDYHLALKIDASTISGSCSYEWSAKDTWPQGTDAIEYRVIATCAVESSVIITIDRRRLVKFPNEYEAGSLDAVRVQTQNAGLSRLAVPRSSVQPVGVFSAVLLW